MATTWSTTDKANCTLTGSNLVATMASGGAVRSADRVYSGKYYWEITFTTLTNLAVGVSTAAAPLGNGMGSGTAASYTFLVTNAGAIFAPGNVIANVGGTLTAGWVCGIALDADIGQVWFRNGAAGLWDGNAAHNPATGAGGYNMPTYFGAGKAFGIYASASGGGGSGVATANFGASGFVGAVPVGFTSGFPDSTTLFTNAVATQALAEHWLSADPEARVTQMALEQWISVSTTNLQAIVTQVALEHWTSVASVVPATGGPIVTMIH